MPVAGLDRSLKVELAAGAKKEILALEPSDGVRGGYSAIFIPTVQTTYSYRIFGTIDSDPIDLTFTCVPGEVSETAEDNSQVKLSNAITRLGKVGSFGCPAARSTQGFPEPALSSYELNQSMQSLAATVQMANQGAGRARALSLVGFGSGLAGLVVAVVAWKRK